MGLLVGQTDNRLGHGLASHLDSTEINTSTQKVPQEGSAPRTSVLTTLKTPPTPPPLLVQKRKLRPRGSWGCSRSPCGLRACQTQIPELWLSPATAQTAVSLYPSIVLICKMGVLGQKAAAAPSGLDI